VTPWRKHRPGPKVLEADIIVVRKPAESFHRKMVYPNLGLV
jgi:hypothetical protein